MQAVILAGGLGTRLWPLTQEVPKPMVPVCGVPYLQHQLELLRRQHITDVLLLTGYLGHVLEQYFGDGSQFGLTIRYSQEQTPLGTAGALREAARHLAGTFLLIYGDSYLPIQYADVLETLGASSALGIMVVYDNHLGTVPVPNNVSLGPDGAVERYAKDDGADPNLRFVEAGVLGFSSAIIDLIPPGKAVSLEKEIFPLLIRQKQLIALPTGQRFYDIGTPERLQAIERLLNS